MKCVICGQPATKFLKCGQCHMLAAYLCNGYVCQPEIWRTQGSVVSLMNMQCEACDGPLSERPLPPSRRFVGPPRPLFPTTLVDAVEYFKTAKVVVVTNVFGDGLGDFTQGLKLAGLLHDTGAQVTFIAGCLDKDLAAIQRTLGGGTPWTTLIKHTANQRFSEYNPVPVAEIDVYESEDARVAMDAANVIVVFPTAPPFRRRESLNAKMICVEECIQEGQHILGFGQTLGRVAPKKSRLGVLLCELGPVDRWNLNDLSDVQLKGLLLDGAHPEAWRVDTLFSIGYLKVPESSPNSFVSIGEGMPRREGLEMKGSGRSLRGPPMLEGRPMLSQPVSLGRPPLLRRTGGMTSSPGLGLLGGPSRASNTFLDNYVKLVCLCAPPGKAVVLYCPNFDPSASRLGLSPSRTSGELRRLEGTLFRETDSPRAVSVVCGGCSQADFLKLLNEAALSGEIHRAPILVGAAGEGSLSEIFSIQTPSRAVFPIYSPRYPYQRENLLRLATVCESEKLAELFMKITALHELDDRQLLALRELILELQPTMREVQERVHLDWNFLNLLFLRLRGEL